MAAWASGEELDDPVKPLALFDWVVKNIQLNEPPARPAASPLVKTLGDAVLGRGRRSSVLWLSCVAG